MLTHITQQEKTTNYQLSDPIISIYIEYCTLPTTFRITVSKRATIQTNLKHTIYSCFKLHTSWYFREITRLLIHLYAYYIYNYLCWSYHLFFYYRSLLAILYDLCPMSCYFLLYSYILMMICISNPHTDTLFSCYVHSLCVSNTHVYIKVNWSRYCPSSRGGSTLCFKVYSR